ncbi:hypothetical protein [Nocardia panacis]|uniref:hypothetical protein n=1 Tax=Nocardia panacis TaxID=2340916 RepID=UPI0011C37FEA|nr:hypothetical protein [Nocardia panacis]
MDPLSIIVTALIAGAAAGGRDAASAAVRDAYSTLRDRLGADRASNYDAVAVIETNEAVPGSNVGELEAAVEHHRGVDEGELRAAAKTLLSLLPSDQVDHARSSIDLHHARRVQVAFDGAQQVNINGNNTGTINLA